MRDKKLIALAEEAVRLENNIKFYEAHKGEPSKDPLATTYMEYLIMMEKRRASYVENTIKSLIEDKER